MKVGRKVLVALRCKELAVLFFDIRERRTVAKLGQCNSKNRRVDGDRRNSSKERVFALLVMQKVPPDSEDFVRRNNVGDLGVCEAFGKW